MNDGRLSAAFAARRRSPGGQRQWGRIGAAIGLAALSSCTSMYNGGYQHYMKAAIEHQITVDAGEPALASATRPAGRPATTFPSASQTLNLTLEKAILMGLANNPSLIVQRYAPAIAQMNVEAQRGVFDPILTAQTTAGKNSEPGSGGYTITGSQTGQVGLSELLPTGTSVQAAANTTINNVEGSGGGQSTSTGGSITVTQALLQGASLRVNLAAIREARIGRRISDYQLRGVAQSIAAQIIQDYWAYALARENVRILRQAVALAQQQEHQARELIRVGRIAPSQFPAAQAEVATIREQLISAEGNLRIARLNLLSLIVANEWNFWRRPLRLLNHPYVPRHALSPLALHTELALRMSPLLNEARLQIQQGNLVVVQTRDGLLPKLDLFITLGKTGYADAFGGSVDRLNGPDYQLLGGLQYSHPVFNRTARANYQSALLSRDQDQAALANLVRSVELSVRTAYIQAQTARQEIIATAATRRAQAESLRATIGEFRVGESTSLLVAQAQNNLFSAQLGEVQAVVNYLDALTQLYLQEGSILERLSVAAPGAVPVRAIGPNWLRRWPDGYFH